jgi:uncharacterized protein (TIGR02145 family)
MSINILNFTELRKKQRFLIYPFLFMSIFLVFASSCKKDDDDGGNNTGIPVLTTTAVADITQTTAISGGNITSDGGATVTVRGVCWSTGATPTISDNKTTDGTGSGNFASNLSGLSANTAYYVRAYATNSNGTGYGSAMSFTSQGFINDTFTDPRDGQVYKTVTIGTQTWFAENLNYTTSNSWWYNNSSANGDIYGRLYTWDAAENACPPGWHLPSDGEWTQLIDYLGGSSVAGGKLKETGTTHWVSPNEGATNETGFTALPGGNRLENGSFYLIGYFGKWWSATEDSDNNVWQFIMYDYLSSVNKVSSNKENGVSVRCVKD